ncbi:unnamed protein product [Peniophora sp. CBMAI 1063]|nr:unnamed protein product [Peniophora sp. CBMAI 1063]
MATTVSTASSTSSSAPSVVSKPQPPINVPQYKFACTLCSIPFARQDDLSDHYRKSLLHPQCDRCGIGARDSTTLADHMRLVHQTATCAFCPGLRMFEEDVKAHRAEKGHTMCSSCNHDFSSREDLTAHVNSVHPSYRCSQCNTSYSSATVLEQHYLDSPAHMKCSKCPNVGFPERVSWEEHIRTNHPDLWCSRCNECFSVASALNNHFQNSFVHPKCYDCGLGFFDEAARQEHVIAVSTVLLEVGTLIAPLSVKMDEEESDIESIASPSTEATNFTAPPLIVTHSAHHSPEARSISLPPPTTDDSDKNGVNREFVDASDDVNIRDADSEVDEPNHSIEAEAPSSELDGMANSTIIVFQVQADVDSPDAPIRPQSAADLRPALASQSFPVTASAVEDIIADAEHDYVDVKDDIRVDGTPCADLRPAEQPEAERVSIPEVTPPSSEAQFNMTGASLSIPLVDSPSVIHTDDSHTLETQTETATPAQSTRSIRPMKLEVLTSQSGSPATVVISPSSLLDAPPHIRSGSALSAYSTRPPSRLHEASRAAPHSPYRERHLEVPDVQFEPTGFPGGFDARRSRTPSVAYSSRQPPVAVPSPRGSRAPSPNVRHIPWTSAHEDEYRAERQDDARRVSYIYCRLCRRDPARTPTATMCGHIYCHSCIVDEVVKSSKCPSCAAPTLLYSLIKLQVL